MPVAYLLWARISANTQSQCTTPDAVVEVRLLMVQDTSGQHAHEFDPQQRRGGVTIDLHDPVVPLVIPAHEFRP